MGGVIAVSALAGSLLSGWIATGVLMGVFAGLAVVAALLMSFPMHDVETPGDASEHGFSRPLAVLFAAVVGVLGGMVGQG